MVAHVAKVTFTRGEITPLAHARRDIELYSAAAKTLHQFFILKQGGIRRRSGTKFIGQIKYADKDTRLIDFVFSNSQAYVLEMGHLYTRYWTNGGQILSGGSPYEVVSPYSESDLRALRWAQSFDVMFFSRQSMTLRPKKLKRFGHTNWTWENVNFYDGPYLPTNDTSNACTSSDPHPTEGLGDTLTFTSTANINGGGGFLSTDIDRHIRVRWNGLWFWGVIASVHSPTSVVVIWKTGKAVIDDLGGGIVPVGDTPPSKDPPDTSDLDATKPSISWRLGAFSDTTGYPGVVGWSDGRLWWGSTPTQPNALWYSRSNLPEVMSPTDYDGTVTDSHGGDLLMLGRADEIQWLVDAPRLQVGTLGAIRTIGGSDTTQAFSPRNVSQRVELTGGVTSTVPAVIGPSAVHVARFGKAIHDLYFDYQANTLVAPELSNLAEHMFENSIIELIYQQKPYSLLWSVLSNGKLVTTTVDRYERVIGFSRQTLTGGEVKSMCTIPGAVQDDLYLVVRRTVNGSLVQYMELLQQPFERKPKSEAWFVDCGGRYSGAPANQVTGITWLEGALVDVLADGVVIPRQTVTGGKITLPDGRTASTITFGIPIFDTEGALLPPPIITPAGSTIGKKMRVVNCVADVYETLGLKFRSDRGQVDALKHRKPSDPMNSGPPLDTGARTLPIDGSWASEGEIGFLCDLPLPCTIRALNIGLDYEH